MTSPVQMFRDILIIMAMTMMLLSYFWPSPVSEEGCFRSLVGVETLDRCLSRTNVTSETCLAEARIACVKEFARRGK